MLCFVDMETTGLDPATCYPLEIGFLLVSDDLTQELASKTWLLMPSFDWPGVMEDALPIVQEMHKESGLTADLDALYATLTEPSRHSAVQAHWRRTIGEIEEWLTVRHSLTGLPLCGSSLRLDRNFMERYMATIHNIFHYRTIDVSAIKEVVRLWHPEFLYPAQEKKAHRPLDDMRHSVAELRHYKETVFK